MRLPKGETICPAASTMSLSFTVVPDSPMPQRPGCSVQNDFRKRVFDDEARRGMAPGRRGLACDPHQGAVAQMSVRFALSAAAGCSASPEITSPSSTSVAPAAISSGIALMAISGRTPMAAATTAPVFRVGRRALERRRLPI